MTGIVLGLHMALKCKYKQLLMTVFMKAASPRLVILSQGA